ncbi:hypothetical protein GCM10023200_36200 [Actinomycetospora chlora]|uniref:TrwC relaxase n=1 Tax=Actinomycetospora chlora TaxID=663608 RepID=A0ABP9BM50_9PSEU
MTTPTPASGDAVEPARLFDPVFTDPPDDAVDVVVPAPRSLAVYMDSLQHTGHAGVLAGLRDLYWREAATCVREVQRRFGCVLTADGPAPARLAITHIVDERVPGVAGLRPHVHVYVAATGTTVAEGLRAPVDLEALAARADDLYDHHRDRLAAATAEGWGLTWGRPTPSAPTEIVEPAWTGRAALELLRREEPWCPGVWVRRQIVAGAAPRREVT